MAFPLQTPASVRFLLLEAKWLPAPWWPLVSISLLAARGESEARGFFLSDPQEGPWGKRRRNWVPLEEVNR